MLTVLILAKQEFYSLRSVLNIVKRCREFYALPFFPLILLELFAIEILATIEEVLSMKFPFIQDLELVVQSQLYLTVCINEIFSYPGSYLLAKTLALM